MKKVSNLLFLLITILLLSTQFGFSLGFGNALDKKKDETKTDSLKPWQIDTLIRPVPINRQYFVDRFKKRLTRADMLDGRLNRKISIPDSLASHVFTRLVFDTIPLISIHIENIQAGNQDKIRYHDALDNLVKRFMIKGFTADNLFYIINSTKSFRGLLIAIQKGTVAQYVRQHNNIYTLDNSDLLEGYPEEKDYLYKTVGLKLPGVMINRLKEYADKSYADTIVAKAAKVRPAVVLKYATSSSPLSPVIRRNTNRLVQTIVKIGDKSRNPLKALPFLGQIFSGETTIAQVDAKTKTPKSYFKALVAAKMENDSIGRKDLDKELNYRGLLLLRVVNGLHESPNKIRFASIMDMSAADLYYMIIASQDEIYTSSFVFMANRLIDLMKENSISGNEFLDKVNYYHFRTWIRMSAGYNTLAPFLATMSEKSKNKLMRTFVANLEKGGPNDLSAAVDVADAFGSIQDTTLRNFLEKQVIKNYKRVKNSRKGTIVYGLLSTILKSSSNSKKLTGKLDIPPITYVPYGELVDSSVDAVIIQAFFYGDKDGHMSFNSFKTNFPSSKWKKTKTKYWVQYICKGKHKVEVYANLPRDGGTNQDLEAQAQLENYLNKHNIDPTIVIHRGHSYHLSNTLKHLTTNVKVVMLGSCGGYHNLAHVLDRAPNANIISSKQTGSMHVNEPIIRELLKELNTGNNLNWVKTWDDLEKYFTSSSPHIRDMFNDYIPPNKNLGAIFIKAYRKMLAQIGGL